MPNLNKWMGMGSLTRDPELKYLPNGTPICEFSIAINERWITDGGEKKESVIFVDCVFFGKRGALYAEHMRKGQPTYVEGKLKMEQWDDKTTGQKRSKMRVNVQEFEFIGGKKEGADMTPRETLTEKPLEPALNPDAGDDDIPF